MIKTIIFDLDGTLYDYDTAHETAYRELCRYASDVLHLYDFDRVYHETMDAIEADLGKKSPAIHDRYLRLQLILEKTGRSLNHVWPMNRLYWETLIENMQPSPGIHEALPVLQRAGYRLGVGTNMNVDYQLRKLEKLGITDYFDFVVCSEEVQTEKPAPEFFTRCLRKAGCKPDECLFIGDHYEMDVLGSLRAGMKALWFTNDRKAHPEVERISDFRQLIPY